MKFPELQPLKVDPVWSTLGDSAYDIAVANGFRGTQAEWLESLTGPPGESVQGPKGEPGADGQGLNPRGRWSPVTTYNPGDVVNHNFESYVAREPSTNKRPTRLSKFWQLLAARGERGERGPAGFGYRGRRGEPGETIVLGGGTSPLDITFGTNALAGNVIYVDNSGIAQLARADAESTVGAVGFVLSDVDSGTGQYLTEGQITRSDWSAIAGTANLVPGEEYYLSSTAAGTITSTPPDNAGEFVLPVGRALSPTVLDIEIGPAVLLSKNTASSGSTSIEAIFDSDASTGDVVFVSASGRVDLAQANGAPQTDAIGFALGNVLAGETGSYATEGTIELESLAVGDAYYLSAISPGAITNVAPSEPGQYVVQVGRAISDSILEIEIEPAILLTGNTTVGSGLTTLTFTVDASQEASQEIALPEPLAIDSVFQNGLRLEEGRDFTVLGAVITFDCISEGDFIVVRGA